MLNFAWGHIGPHGSRKVKSENKGKSKRRRDRANCNAQRSDREFREVDRCSCCKLA